MPLGREACRGAGLAHGRARSPLRLGKVAREVRSREELDDPGVEEQHDEGHEARRHDANRHSVDEAVELLAYRGDRGLGS